MGRPVAARELAREAGGLSRKVALGEANSSICDKFLALCLQAAQVSSSSSSSSSPAKFTGVEDEDEDEGDAASRSRVAGFKRGEAGAGFLGVRRGGVNKERSLPELGGTWEVAEVEGVDLRETQDEEREIVGRPVAAEGVFEEVASGDRLALVLAEEAGDLGRGDQVTAVLKQDGAINLERDRGISTGERVLRLLVQRWLKLCAGLKEEVADELAERGEEGDHEDDAGDHGKEDRAEEEERDQRRVVRVRFEREPALLEERPGERRERETEQQSGAGRHNER